MSLRASFRNHEANSWTILFLTQRLCQSWCGDGPLLPILQPSSCHKPQRCASPCSCTPIKSFSGSYTIEKHALWMLILVIFCPHSELFYINWNFKMKTYMALDGLRWSRDSGSVHCNMPGSVVFGRSGGGNDNQAQNIHIRMFFYGKKYHSIILRSLRTAKILQANE